MRRRDIAILCVAAIGVAVASTTYVHDGYMGVTETGDSIRLMTRGPHFRLPWRHVWFYPIHGGSVNIRVASQGLKETLTADISLIVSVSPDSIPSLQRSFHGNYVQALVVPIITRFVQRRGEAFATWDYDKQIYAISGELTAELNSSLGSYGLAFYFVEVRSFDVKPLSQDSSYQFY